MPRGGARKGAGRPPGSTKEGTATEWVQIRVTHHEKETLRARAAARGIKISEYVKMCALMGKE
jgi:hypothetical protein